METDFTRYMIEDVENGEILLYHNFCILDEEPLKRGPFENILPLDCIHEAKIYARNVEEVIKWALEYPYEKCIKILDYLFNKIDDYIDLYSKLFGVDPNYEPDQETIEKYMENPYADDFDEDLYFRLQEEAYDKAIKIYEKEHGKEADGLLILERAKYNVEKQIYYQKSKYEFVNKALKCRRKVRKDIHDFISASVIDKDEMISFIKKHLLNKEGRAVALLIIAWQKAGYLTISDGKRSAFYDSIRETFRYYIGTNQSIDKYLRKSIGDLKTKREYAFWDNTEIVQAMEHFCLQT